MLEQNAAVIIDQDYMTTEYRAHFSALEDMLRQLQDQSRVRDYRLGVNEDFNPVYHMTLLCAKPEQDPSGVAFSF